MCVEICGSKNIAYIGGFSSVTVILANAAVGG